MTGQSADAALVERVRGGDTAAFDLLVVKYQHRILKLVGRYVRDPTEAEDVTQEAFIKAFRAIPRFRGDSAFYTWIYRIAINTAKNPAEKMRCMVSSMKAISHSNADWSTSLR